MPPQRTTPGARWRCRCATSREFAPDLEEVAGQVEARQWRRSPAIHAAGEYRVLMIGFAPGPRLHGRARCEARGAAARYAARAGAGRRGGDRQRADGGLSLRHLRRLERHRPHAARGVRRRPRGAEPASPPATACASSAITRAHRDSRPEARRHERPRAAAGPAHDACRTTAATATSTSACAPAARWTRWRSRSPTRWSATKPDEAALEITVIGPELPSSEDTLVALCGAEFEGSFPHQPAGARARRAAGSTSAARCAARAPISRWRAASRSSRCSAAAAPTCRGSFGGFEGRALKHGDVLPLRDPRAPRSASPS